MFMFIIFHWLKQTWAARIMGHIKSNAECADKRPAWKIKTWYGHVRITVVLNKMWKLQGKLFLRILILGLTLFLRYFFAMFFAGGTK